MFIRLEIICNVYYNFGVVSPDLRICALKTMDL